MSLYIVLFWGVCTYPLLRLRRLLVPPLRELPPECWTGTLLIQRLDTKLYRTQAIQSEAYAVLVVVGNVILYA